MSHKKWLVAGAGAGVMAVLGSIYSWSLFSQSLGACFGWSQLEATVSFSVAIFFLGLGAFAGGRIQARVGSRKAAMLGAILWGLGNLLAGMGLESFGVVWMAVCYGVVGGFGVGMGYVACVACVSRWFSDRPGMGTGIVVMGFGAGAFIYSFVVKSVPAFAAMAVASSEALESGADALGAFAGRPLSWTLIATGVASIVLGSLFASRMEDAPTHELGSDERAALEASSYSSSQVLRERAFYVLWGMLFVNILVGIMLIGNAVPIMQEFTSLPPETIAATWAVLALANVAGRFVWGAAADAIGARASFALIYGTQAIAFLALGYFGIHDLFAVGVAVGIIVLGYGGGFGLMPAVNARYFGMAHVGSNYGMLLTAWGVAGAIGPLFGAAIKDATGSFHESMPILAATMVGALILPILATPPKGRAALGAPGAPELDSEAGSAIEDAQIPHPAASKDDSF